MAHGGLGDLPYAAQPRVEDRALRSRRACAAGQAEPGKPGSAGPGAAGKPAAGPLIRPGDAVDRVRKTPGRTDSDGC